MMKTRRSWAAFFLAMTIVTAAMIFCFSAQTAVESSEASDRVTLTAAEVIKPDYREMPAPRQRSFLEQLSYTIRKCAHFCEFTLLGLNLMCWLRLRFGRLSARTAGLIAWTAATLYAGTDELHQMFVSERSPALLDVGIDSGGALTGILLAALLLALLGHRLGLRLERAETGVESM